MRSNPAAAMSNTDPMLPRRFRIERMKREIVDTFTMFLKPADGGEFHFAPGQFNMLYVFGVGEVPISISGDSDDPSVLVHTTRAVGAVTRAMGKMKAGDIIGVRGPFGTPWPIEEAYGSDVIFVAGGLGLAPLRPAIYKVLDERLRFGNVEILYGARTPQDALYRKDLHWWRGRFDVRVHVTVDRTIEFWGGRVGVVPKIVGSCRFDPMHTAAFICGPEVMMRYTVQALQDRGVNNEDIYLSMERNMKCAVGFCGHCQWGPHFVCKDGPVFSLEQIEDIFTVWEL